MFRHTLAAFYASITNGSTYANVAGVADQSQNLDASSRLQIRGNPELAAIYAQGINLTACRLDAPSLRGIVLPEIYPVNPTADVRTIDRPAVTGGRFPRLVEWEGFNPQVSRGGADAQPVAVGVWLSYPGQAMPAGRVFTVPYTAAPTIVAGSWVFSTLTAVQALPAGEYAVVGMAVVCNDATFARLVFTGDGYMRPGVLVQDAYGDQPTDDDFRFGRFGVFGTFVHNAPPNVEFLGDTAGAESAVVYLDIVKVR